MKHRTLTTLLGLLKLNVRLLREFQFQNFSWHRFQFICRNIILDVNKTGVYFSRLNLKTELQNRH